MSITDFDKGWVIGFIEGRGSFTVNIVKFRRETKSGVKHYRYVNPAFYLVQKDRGVLEKVKSLLRMGKINRHGTLFHLDIRKKTETIRLVEFLDGKIKSESKAQQFEKWKEKVLEWKSRAWGEGAVSPQVNSVKVRLQYAVSIV